MIEKKRDNPVLVTTAHRGVFFGYLNGRKPAKAQLVLDRCRNCGFWSKAMSGFLGLASIGPDSDCKVGPAASRVTLYDITSVTEVEPQAVEKWEAATW